MSPEPVLHGKTLSTKEFCDVLIHEVWAVTDGVVRECETRGKRKRGQLPQRTQRTHWVFFEVDAFSAVAYRRSGV
jgi:hypothetical protein